MNTNQIRTRVSAFTDNTSGERTAKELQDILNGNSTIGGG